MLTEPAEKREMHKLTRRHRAEDLEHSPARAFKRRAAVKRDRLGEPVVLVRTRGAVIVLPIGSGDAGMRGVVSVASQRDGGCARRCEVKALRFDSKTASQLLLIYLRVLDISQRHGVRAATALNCQIRIISRAGR